MHIRHERCERPVITINKQKIFITLVGRTRSHFRIQHGAGWLPLIYGPFDCLSLKTKGDNEVSLLFDVRASNPLSLLRKRQTLWWILRLLSLSKGREISYANRMAPQTIFKSRRSQTWTIQKWTECSKLGGQMARKNLHNIVIAFRSIDPFPQWAVLCIGQTRKLSGRTLDPDLCGGDTAEVRFP